MSGSIKVCFCEIMIYTKWLIKHPESLIGEKNLKGKTKQAKLIKLQKQIKQ